MKHKSTHGAISVFLAIILVPCIVITSIFVDLGRSYMSRSMAESAGDLALNTLMTNYDADLSEWYGLIASCQNVDEYYEVTARYFLRCMMSQKMEKDETILVSDYAQQAFEDKSITDLLLCDVQTPASEIIRPVPDANLSSSGLVKAQIIEFMKYRAPIEICRGLFGRLSGDSESDDNGGGTDQSEDRKGASEASKNEQHVENKRNYYEAEGELDSAAFHTYVAIRQYYRDGVCEPYDKHQNPAPLDNARLGEYCDKINSYRVSYASIHAQYVEYFATTEGLSVYQRPVVKQSDYNETEPEKVFKKDKDEKYYEDFFEEDKNESGEKIWTVTGENYHALLDLLKKSVEEFDEARSAYAEAANEMLNRLYGPADTDPNAIQWWVRMNKAVNASSGKNHTKAVREAGEKMMLLAMEVRLAESDEVEIIDPFPAPSTKPESEKTPEEKDHERDVHERAEELLEQADKLRETYLTAGKTDAQDAYLYAVSALEKVSKENADLIDPTRATVELDGASYPINNVLDGIATNLSGMLEKLDFMIEKLDLAIDGDGDETKSLKELESLADKYHSALNKFSSSANEGGTQMKDYDKKAINGELTGKEAQMNVSEAAKKITAAAVRALRARLVNIRSQLQKVSDAIKGFTYGGVCVAELRDVEAMRKKVNNQAIVNYFDQDWTNAGVKAAAEKTFRELVKPEGDTVVTLDHLTEDNYDPDIDPVNPEKHQTPELYVYFHSLWADKPDDALEESDKIKDAVDDLCDSMKEASLDDVVKEDKDRVDIKREFSGDSEFSVASGFLDGATGLIEAVIDGNFDKFRDDLYGVTYLMGMFSFDTYSNEGKWKLQSLDNRKDKIGLINYSFAYKNVEDQWNSDELTDHWNKSLTNKKICRENNAAWEAELEYLLYGKSSCSKNVRDAYSSIFGIRTLMNLGSAFQNFFPSGVNNTSRVFDAIASAISAACLGIIPPPVWKCLLLVVLAMAESGMDLLRLSRGFPVPLYKVKAEQWYLHIPDAEEIEAKADAMVQGGADAILDTLKSTVSQDKPEEKPIGVDPMPNGNNGLYYSDYLMLFLFLGVSSHGALERDIYLRTAEVIQTNMRQHDGIDESYSLKKSQVYFKLHSVVRVRPLMITLPIVRSYDGADTSVLETYSDWCTYQVELVRGYS